MHTTTVQNPLLNPCKVKIMGILNVTPDSFSDGGIFIKVDKALDHVAKMIDAGCDIIDIGGESTRPGAAQVTVTEELERVVPVINSIRQHFDTVISIDTSKIEVMREAVAAGANMINDVRALQLPGALDAVADLDVPVCMMHMQGQPDTMQDAPVYDDVVAEVKVFLADRIKTAIAAGIKKENILIDPGFGFGKTMENNYLLLQRLEEFHQLDVPLLVGLSRKSMLGNLLNKAEGERLSASLACAVIAASKGAQIIRVHDVAETADVIKVVTATENAGRYNG